MSTQDTVRQTVRENYASIAKAGADSGGCW